MKNKRLFISVLCSQVFVIISISGYILFKTNVLGTAVINPVSKEFITRDTVSDLYYYYEPKPNQKEIVNEWGPYNGTYLINADSFNERFNYQINKNHSTFRIVTLGDSYTYGLYVNTSDNWSEQLEDLMNNTCKKYKRYEVINLGVHGYDIEYAVERFRLRGQKYTPDYVIWLLKDDDLFQVNEIMLFNLDEDNQRLDEQESWIRAYKKMIDDYGPDYTLQYQKKIMKEFFTSYSENLAFMTFPRMNKFSVNLISDVFPESSKVSFIELEDIYADKSLYYPNDYHPTAQGHTVIAEDALQFFKDNNYCD